MMEQNIVVVDGIDTIALHNGLYRIGFFVLAADGKPHKKVELVAGPGPLKEIIKALAKLPV